MIRLTRTRRVWLASLGVAVVVASIASRAVAEAPAPLEREGDRAASAYADGELLEQLRRLAAVPGASPGDVAAFFGRPASPGETLFPFDLRLLSQKGDVFVAAAYRFERDASLLWRTGDYWGQACRRYVVQSSRVTSEPIECPPEAPEWPTGRGD
ncbi:hypothetical protein [Microbacterium testaceum]|uniref:hypothetical protein n=1 Tax=Microbacterium testaceum TaxID=2033 RepID=UPI0025AEDB2D|nr:hypothetical protein [Microbacterium testaceum]WJS89474.1 hypothetical protein NYQ11_08930 [Microbacterium testaceum]